MQANRLLGALPRKSLESLHRDLVPVTLGFGDVLYEPGSQIRAVYFPQCALVLLLTLAGGSRALEIGLVGPEGMVGLPLALGADVSPVRALVQGPGQAMKMKAQPFCRALTANPALHASVQRYAYERMVQITRSVACNRFHAVKPRLARWLLMTRDRAGADEFHLTHAFLSYVLGVRRVGVTTAAVQLQEHGLIEYRRGDIRIVDHAGLEAAACSCYGLSRTALA